MIILNGEIVEPTIFPDKTSQIWKVDGIEGKDKYNIEFHFEHEGEVFQLMQLVHLIKYVNRGKLLIGTFPFINLHMPYLPYGRQDKEVSNNNTFALRTFCKLLNTFLFDSITTIDAHSDLAENLLENFENIYPDKQIDFALGKTGADTIAFPDDGAEHRYGPGYTNLITGKKVRDQQTGYITSYTFEGDPKGKDILIIDDICDGGMTFIKLAEGLLKAEAKNVYLYVTHGIFSKGFKPLTDAGISRIFTKDGEILHLHKGDK